MNIECTRSIGLRNKCRLILLVHFGKWKNAWPLAKSFRLPLWEHLQRTNRWPSAWWVRAENMAPQFVRIQIADAKGPLGSTGTSSQWGSLNDVQCAFWNLYPFGTAPIPPEASGTTHKVARDDRYNDLAKLSDQVVAVAATLYGTNDLQSTWADVDADAAEHLSSVIGRCG